MKNHQYSAITRLLHQKIDDTLVRPVVTPLYQNSAFSADSPYFYTRKNNPNCEELEQVIALLEETSHAVAVTTGMSAISTTCSLLSPGDGIVLNKDIYGCSFKFFQRLAARMNLRMTVLDLSRQEEIVRIPGGTRMVFFETPTNPYLKTVHIKSVSEKAKRMNPDAVVVVDNTWATPLFQKPLQHGADISLYSATKFFSGHSDVMGGMIATDRKDIAEKLRAERFYSGSILDPHSAWLIRRSMQTFSIRMHEHERVTKDMTDFVKGLKQVTRVYYPEIDGSQMQGYGGIIFFDLREDLVERYGDFTSALSIFRTGTGMACVTSMVAQPYTGSHASMSDTEKEEMGLSRKLIRLCFGFEDPEDLKKDIVQALNTIDG